MAARILHVSDLHTGTREGPEIEAALRRLLGRVEAELIVASGDLTHRGRRDEHERAHRFLTSFGLPVLTVPGNHDMPYTFPARFTSTYTEFERQWGTIEQPVQRGLDLGVLACTRVEIGYMEDASRHDRMRL